MRIKRVQIANLPPKVPDWALRTVLDGYGEVMVIQAETWSRFYRYTVANGIRLANDNAGHIYSVAYYCGWQQGAGIIQGTTNDVLWL
jgi:hypothetical protein